MPDYHAVKRRLSRVSIDELRNIIGSELIEMANNGTYRMSLADDLAEILHLKLGQNLLANRQLRYALVDGFSEQEFQSIKRLSGANIESLSDIYKYFKTFTKKKSEVLVSVLGWPQAYIMAELIDTREACFVAKCEYGESVKLRGYLHPYQKNIKDEINKRMNRNGARAMVQMPTGSGKTFTALETFVDLIRSPLDSDQRWLIWLVNKPDLAEQALNSFAELWKVKGDRPLKLWRYFDEWNGPPTNVEGEEGIVFCTFDKLYIAMGERDSEAYKSMQRLAKSTQYLIVDEAHMSVAETYEKVIQFLIFYGSKLIGLSATPYRSEASENSELTQLYGSTLINLKRDERGYEISDPISYLQGKGYLAKVVMIPFETGTISNEENEEKLLRELSKKPNRNLQILNLIKDANERQQKTMVFGCTKDHVIMLQMLCRKEGVKSRVIVGETSPTERLEIFDEFRKPDSDLYILINFEILSTGIDLPNIDKIIMARPVKSPTQYSQMVGRALRGPKNGGNDTNEIVNLIDNLDAYGNISTLYNSFMNDWMKN